MTDDNEEQVIGRLLRCEVCGEKTLHVDGVCQDHKIVRRRKKPAGVLGALESRREKLAAERAADEAAAAAKRARGSGGRVRNVVAVIVVGGLIWLMGATHVLHGDKGIAFCWKAGWSLSDTFVDTDKLVSEPPPKKVFDALAACAY